jgi:hypothetical protein
MSVGGPRHSGQRLRDAAWTCQICGFLNVSGSVCAQCQNNPEWRRPQPQPTPTGAQAAREVMEQISTPPPEAYESEVHRDFLVHVVATSELTTVTLTLPTGNPFAGSGITLQEALVSAVAAMEEDEARPKCPTCGQAWPEDREFPESES